ncbi:MAG: undecaprenyldiphospho-muramoylpentapeptide beta-N-acetylglucosaminyltransferase [Gammaproteobacteria bacterium]|nr:undecaprenyldiphospho-muramoylpentapeptide beta-N-acetylglucosaminyltransferase [Gammaproteobacteria bacterium]
MLRGPVLITAGGTGGHVYPALAVADCLRERGVGVVWLGVARGFEESVVRRAGIEFFGISGGGLRGKGVRRWLSAPFKLSASLRQALRVLRQQAPCVVLGMGGFASGPGGLAARLRRVPLVIHEQNAVPGLTNKVLARLATRVLEAFPQSFAPDRHACCTGNPVRATIAAIAEPEVRLVANRDAVRVLVLGGSQGADALNRVVPVALAALAGRWHLQIRHQCGPRHLDVTREAYARADLAIEPEAFIDDMASAYAWADLAICRAGAMTVAELAAAGVPSILIPYPYAVDNHQARNAAYLSDGGAAFVLPESELDASVLEQTLQPLMASAERRLQMSTKARALARPDAARAVARICMEVADA